MSILTECKVAGRGVPAALNHRLRIWQGARGGRLDPLAALCVSELNRDLRPYGS